MCVRVRVCMCVCVCVYVCVCVRNLLKREGDTQKYDYFFISLLNSTKDVKRVVKK